MWWLLFKFLVLTLSLVDCFLHSLIQNKSGSKPQVCVILMFWCGKPGSWFSMMQYSCSVITIAYVLAYLSCYEKNEIWSDVPACCQGFHFTIGSQISNVLAKSCMQGKLSIQRTWLWPIVVTARMRFSCRVANLHSEDSQETYIDSYKDTEHSPAIRLEILADVIIAIQVYKLRKCIIGN